MREQVSALLIRLESAGSGAHEGVKVHLEVEGYAVVRTARSIPSDPARLADTMGALSLTTTGPLPTPSGFGDCAAFVTWEPRTSCAAVTIWTHFDAVVDSIASKILRGPRGKPTDPAALHFETVREPYVFRLWYRDESAQREVAATFSRPEVGVLGSHSHTRGLQGRVGCVFIRDTVRADETSCLWMRTCRFRLSPSLSWRLLGRVFAFAQRRTMRKSLETGKRQLEVVSHRAVSS
jgi:hypothetical protein